jgi:hypothetical protein
MVMVGIDPVGHMVGVGPALLNLGDHLTIQLLVDGVNGHFEFMGEAEDLTIRRVDPRGRRDFERPRILRFLEYGVENFFGMIVGSWVVLVVIYLVVSGVVKAWDTIFH